MLTPDGKLGQYTAKFDEQSGKGIRLELYDPSGELISKQPISAGVKHLLQHNATKVGAMKGLYTPEDLEVYNSIAKQAGTKFPKHNNRAKFLQPGLKQAIFMPGNPSEMKKRLEILLGLKADGNCSQEACTEGCALADRLLRDRHMTKAEHKEVFEKFYK